VKLSSKVGPCKKVDFAVMAQRQNLRSWAAVLWCDAVVLKKKNVLHHGGGGGGGGVLLWLP
jgi:hypothetical protein